jgi:hypothetical protein
MAIMHSNFSRYLKNLTDEFWEILFCVCPFNRIWSFGVWLDLSHTALRLWALASDQLICDAIQCGSCIVEGR